jgi:hypothetical protein
MPNLQIYPLNEASAAVSAVQFGKAIAVMRGVLILWIYSLLDQLQQKILKLHYINYEQVDLFLECMIQVS